MHAPTSTKGLYGVSEFCNFIHTQKLRIHQPLEQNLVVQNNDCDAFSETRFVSIYNSIEVQESREK